MVIIMLMIRFFKDGLFQFTKVGHSFLLTGPVTMPEQTWSYPLYRWKTKTQRDTSDFPEDLYIVGYRVGAQSIPPDSQQSINLSLIQ